MWFRDTKDEGRGHGICSSFDILWHSSSDRVGLTHIVRNKFDWNQIQQTTKTLLPLSTITRISLERKILVNNLALQQYMLLHCSTMKVSLSLQRTNTWVRYLLRGGCPAKPFWWLILPLILSHLYSRHSQLIKTFFNLSLPTQFNMWIHEFEFIEMVDSSYTEKWTTLRNKASIERWSNIQYTFTISY